MQQRSLKALRVGVCRALPPAIAGSSVSKSEDGSGMNSAMATAAHYLVIWRKGNRNIGSKLLFQKQKRYPGLNFCVVRCGLRSFDVGRRSD